MKKTTLTLQEIMQLDGELNGVRHNQTGEELSTGLLKEKLSMVTKYWLSDLSKKVAAEKASVEKLRDELIQKHGEPSEDGGFAIPMTIEVTDGDNVSKKINPSFAEFNKEFSELLSQEREIEHKEFSLDSFEKLETEAPLNIFFKLLSVD